MGWIGDALGTVANFVVPGSGSIVAAATSQWSIGSSGGGTSTTVSSSNAKLISDTKSQWASALSRNDSKAMFSLISGLSRVGIDPTTVLGADCNTVWINTTKVDPSLNHSTVTSDGTTKGDKFAALANGVPYVAPTGAGAVAQTANNVTVAVKNAATSLFAGLSGNTVVGTLVFLGILVPLGYSAYKHR